MAEFNGKLKTGNSLLHPFEQRLVRLLNPLFSRFFETYELTWLTLLWSIGILVFSYAAKSDFIWLWAVNIFIICHYISDLMDGAVGRKKRTGLIRWGYFMDHFFDYVFLCSILTGYMFLIDFRYHYLFLFLLAIFSGFMINSFLDFSVTNKFNITYFLIGPTEIRLTFILINIAIMLWGITVITTALPWTILFSGLVLCIIVYRTQKSLWREEMLLANRAKQTQKKHILRYRLFKKKYFFILVVIIFGYLNAYVYLTNPFHSITIVKNPFTTSIENGEIKLHKQFSLGVETNMFDEGFAYYKSAAHIIANTYTGSQRAKDITEQSIIQDIHDLRFKPSYPYLISGDHFVVLYPRNLGIFYASTLDPQTALSEKDWEDRQRIYLQTTAYALDTFAKFHNLSTTIVPIGTTSVTPINIFVYPSDTLYGILYALNLMQTSNQYGQYHMQTITASRILTGSYMDSLKELLHVYQQTVIDPKSGLVRKDIHLSSARDSVIRESSFYDNVIYWKTLQLARDLGITNTPQDKLDALKKHILQTFWNNKDGYFLNDLSGKTEYSSDWLIAYSTGFLDLSNEQDRADAEKAVDYLQRNGIDQPFGVKYDQETNPANEFPFVRYFVPNYGESAIWSHWGMEYVKLLIALYKQTGNTAYKNTAQKNLHAYAKNIITYQGYPEVYSEKGKYLENGIYKSIRQTGWVVNYEEAKFLLTQTQ